MTETRCISTSYMPTNAMRINKLYSIMTEMKTDSGIQEPRITPYRSKPYILLA
ncbi:hypothetical protein DPMN_087132 [Dreissena polymorpha]|uniref:Uncharacterized protein n=1 Tax=Dreissena polymorpha TaxID=45954 RepID=A0A9D4KS44_DREPO|nr:hypothetical protein DPMN_087132 [Dreissena polymorpha]